MGKKYLETKKDSLESSVLGVWKTAIEEGDARDTAVMDGRTKSYKEHRAKLEASRKKRLERKNSAGSKFIENIKKKTIEVAYGHGFDIMKPMVDMSNRDLQASKKKKKK